ncbi:MULTISPECIES: hypothetical protein [unclassified Bradyrhizobium]|uniref:hypothetical protein n=1 Tax=unclassified Bradyrhizobium TaxID=2631580 RepID=UPI0023062C18|nr:MULTISPECIES: hypothetical protein [unclassified Bradyrhizobium]MDA9446607.1 hypothetical protein [Bradyrhizobium sp. CCBAU 21360]MDA9458925.1 hypothetical protein [Bradyrhizobium sp. CCBAU 21359]MDA9513960.1 hypothetical protein [Bradyrhizobium sp. CCBAU 11430]
MPDVTYYVALPFLIDEDGSPVAGAAEECQTSAAALRRAEMLARGAGHIGAVAFSRSGDPLTGEFGDAKLLRKFGNVPPDLSAL